MRLILAFAMLWASFAVAEEKPVEIPLKEVWALGMPDTLDVQKLDVKLDRPKLSNRELIKQSLVEGIRHAIRERAAEGKSPGPGFVVVGTDAEALKNAHAVITDPKKKRKPERLLPSGVDLSLVFYSHTSGRYVWITEIKRHGNRYLVTYQAVPHDNLIATNHFALIPIGPLSEGDFQVTFKQAPAMDSKGRASTLPESSRQRLVSDSFSFAVRN